jgi:hypothetical protein
MKEKHIQLSPDLERQLDRMAAINAILNMSEDWDEDLLDQYRNTRSILSKSLFC